jgi:hypothetical protein
MAALSGKMVASNGYNFEVIYFIMSNSLNIRSVAPADFAQWRLLWEGYHKFYERDNFPNLLHRSTSLIELTWLYCV